MNLMNYFKCGPIKAVLLCGSLWAVVFLWTMRNNYCTGGANELKKLTIETAKIFNLNQIKYWADYGTLLGIIRESLFVKLLFFEFENSVDCCT